MAQDAMYHITKDISLSEQLFTPRIPANRRNDEDATIKRICVAPAIGDCIKAFPGRHDIVYHLRYNNTPLFISVFPFKNYNADSVRSPHDILPSVPDAIENNEHWLLETITSMPFLCKIKSLSFEHWSKTTWTAVGDIIDLQLERDIEGYDRIETATFYHKQYYREFKTACMENGIQVLNTQTRKERMRYSVGYNGTRKLSSKVYAVKKVKYQIPAGRTAKRVWNAIFKEMKKNEKKHIVYPYDAFRDRDHRRESTETNIGSFVLNEDEMPF